MFNIKVEKNIAKIVDSEPMTSGSSKVYLVHFDFSEEWDDLERVAVFKAGDTIVDVLLDDANLCFMPWEVLVNYDVAVRLGAYGTKNGDVVLPTIWVPTEVILEGVVTGAAASPPSPTLYDQLLGRLSQLDKLDEIEADFDGLVRQDEYKSTTEAFNKTLQELSKTLSEKISQGDLDRVMSEIQKEIDGKVDNGDVTSLANEVGRLKEEMADKVNLKDVEKKIEPLENSISELKDQLDSIGESITISFLSKEDIDVLLTEE